MRWRTWTLSLLLACVLAPPAAMAARGPLRIMSADAPPITGYCVEVVREVQRRIGDRAPIQVLPWARAYSLSQAGENIMLACPKRTPRREALFNWVGPVLESRTYLYALRSARLKLATLDDARKLDGILLPREFYTHEFLTDAGFTNLEPVNNSRTMMAMLLAGRRQAMVIDSEELPVLLADAKAPADQVEPVLFLMSIHSYFAFPRDTPPAQLAQWQKALDGMARDGTLVRLRKQWLHR